MAALTADKKQIFLGEPLHVISYKVATSTTIYNGALVALNSSGYLVNASDTASTIVVGFAMEQVVNSGANGAKSIQVATGAIGTLVAGTNINQADVGALAYVSDNQTVTDAATATNDIPVGRIVSYDSAAGTVMVRVMPGGNA